MIRDLVPHSSSRNVVFWYMSAKKNKYTTSYECENQTTLYPAGGVCFICRFILVNESSKKVKAHFRLWALYTRVFVVRMLLNLDGCDFLGF